MRDLLSNEFKARLVRAWLDLNARADSATFGLLTALHDGWENFSAFMDRFYVGGWKRWVLIEPLSEVVTLGTVGAVVMLGLAIPAFRETTPDWLKRTELAVTFLDRYGNEVGRRGVRQNDTVPLEDFPDHLIKAVLATEDRRFFEHIGIDFGGTLRALTANARAGGVVQGGSSITQQLAKNLFLSNERTIERKVKEAFLAFWLETHLTKNQILKLYLDRAYLGGGAFGADAAAQYYFGKSVRDVNVAEAAMLAGLFKAPTKFAPHVNLPAARGRANVVLDNLVDAGLMTEGQVFGARRNPATPIERRDEKVPNYYLDWAFGEVEDITETLPKSVTERVFVVRTALDPNIQYVAEMAVEEKLRQYGRKYGASQAATVIMDVDGAVRAMVGGRDYGASQFNRATDALRQPGSSFKPYVYATAFLNGLKPTSTVRDEPICLGNWCPQNYGRSFAGTVTLHYALQKSINTVPVRLSVMLGKGTAKAGRAKIIDTAHRMGISTPLPDSSSLPIGAAEVTVIDQTQAYAAFATGGMKVTAHAALEIKTPTGETVWRFDRDAPKSERVLPQQVAEDINRALKSAVEDGTGRRAMLDGVRASGKTGTTNGYRDAWFVGYTGNYVGAVWFGNDDHSPTNRMTGGTLPAMTWQQIMAYAHQGIELKTMPGVGAEPKPPKADTPVAQSGGDSGPQRPMTLSTKASSVLNRIEKLMRDSGVPVKPQAAATDERAGTLR
ncbi:transglycosylase domain-containing protein [Blastochloris viridis]|uniref:Multimodular transpeptidase-transglycosylase n=1 Tax=Blastochloris viridis TaxID=1079 RepID=A0A182D357_BLAVI|nr:PBP1A family penicillin-binding protein [Blastochloris viridis]BAR99920.1 multimodular transpeptidase-transglycosylase [Blastochloris viridis]